MKVTNPTTLNVETVIAAFETAGWTRDMIAEISMKVMNFRGTEMVEVRTTSTRGSQFVDHFSFDGVWLD